MPIAFARLRIAGFKSFAEPATVEIMPGLTGIVGPNGCGKSNVVEALRWAMGESSARSLRGGEMDDVIFAGTATRPSRNLAEVVLTLEEAVGVAPPPFHEQAELQVSRKIVRGVGSGFRINGREARARDVQTLFADLASGARSSAMVSQGRVGTIVNARPDERRSLLEEAAGITGLHARRHEAELKLRAAEANVERAEDLRGQLEAQLTGLQRQAQQAARYRTVTAGVRTAEAELLSLQRARAVEARIAATTALDSARAAVTGCANEATASEARASDASAALPALRNREAEARTALERHKLAREQIVAEGARARDALAAAAQRRTQIARDLGYAEQAQTDAAAATARLASESERHRAQEADAPARLAAAEAHATATSDAARNAEREANAATEQAAELSATSQALMQALAAAEGRARRLGQQIGQLRDERERAARNAVPPAQIEAATTALAAAGERVAAARIAQDDAEKSRAAAQDAIAVARERDGRLGAVHAKLAAETQALGEVLAVKDGERWPPMVDSLDVPAGLEAAIGAVLGEELGAAANPQAARHWRALPALQQLALPEGSTPLGGVVAGPPMLARALAGIGLVDDDAAGDAAQPRLAAGQMLVSREGAVWRWDGYTIRAGTPTAAAVRLQQRNRLAGLRAKLAVARTEAQDASVARTQADAAERAATLADQHARNARRDAEQALERARADHARLLAQAQTAASRLAGLDQQIERLAPEAEDADAALAKAQADRAALPDLSMLRQTVERARAGLTAARAAETAAQAAWRDLSREAASRIARIAAIGKEAEDWTMRAKDAASRVTDLAARNTEAAREHAALEAAPAAIAIQAGGAAAALEAAQTRHKQAAADLDQAVAAETRTSQQSRAAAQALGSAREAIVRAEAASVAADHAWGTVSERILEKLGVNAELPPAPADVSPEAEERTRRRWDRLQKERDEMGPVNMRAELESAEVQTRIDAINTERDELGTAIAKLRGSIGHLNREGRERLTTVFHQVDKHFQSLFARMFNGGRAHLAMVGSDDPLQAGLEIYAQPPGKKLATLSLLSGGEQALTALSLIFAVFRCNPAPVCVLDEVDAPLDDANVERFCTLLAEMVKETGTRFLVVTHHHLTMARMDRLYGVTMQERGVSRLLSVDLQRASEMVDQQVAAE
ncbi:MAG: chromosome segregation protein SMC [Janthinobacterium lividum]